MAAPFLTERKPLLLRVTYWLAAIEVVIAAVFTLLAAGYDLFASTVVTRMPVKSFWPDLKPSVEIIQGPTVHITSGGFTIAEVGVTELDVGTRMLLALAEIFQGAMVVSIGIAVAVLCSRLLRGDPFGSILSRIAFTTAAAIGIGGILCQMLEGIAGLMVSAHALTVTGWKIADSDVGGDDLGQIGWPLPADSMTIDFWPIGAALALAAVAVAFRYGEKLQSDTARLKREKRALQRDTEGLI